MTQGERIEIQQCPNRLHLIGNYPFPMGKGYYGHARVMIAARYYFSRYKGERGEVRKRYEIWVDGMIVGYGPKAADVLPYARRWNYKVQNRPNPVMAYFGIDDLCPAVAI